MATLTPKDVRERFGVMNATEVAARLGITSKALHSRRYRGTFDLEPTSFDFSPKPHWAVSDVEEWVETHRI